MGKVLLAYKDLISSSSKGEVIGEDLLINEVVIRRGSDTGMRARNLFTHVRKIAKTKIERRRRIPLEIASDDQKKKRASKEKSFTSYPYLSW